MTKLDNFELEIFLDFRQLRKTKGIFNFEEFILHNLYPLPAKQYE